MQIRSDLLHIAYAIVLVYSLTLCFSLSVAGSPIQAFFSSDSHSNMESEQVEIELAMSLVAAQCDNPRGDLESENASGSKNEAELCTMTECGLEESQELLLQPNKPRLKSFPAKQIGKNKVE